MRGWVLFACVLLASCGGTAPSPRAPAAAAPVAAPEPATPTDFVRMLEAIASGARPGSLEDHVDHGFAERLASSDELAGLFRGYPEGCTPELEEGPGYGAVAIPPPMVDDDDAEARRIEAIIDELRASTEVLASCRVVERIEDEDVPQQLMLFAVAVRRGEDGRLRAMAWRDFRNEGYGGY